MIGIAKKIKNASQRILAKAKTEKDHAKGRPRSGNVNKGRGGNAQGNLDR
jgi:hypothetical protein